MELPPAELIRIRELYSQGHYRQALTASEPFGPLQSWTNTPARVLAGRLAMQLGGPRLGRKLHALAYRQSPTYPDAVYYFARYRFERFGPLSCWLFMNEHPDWSEASPEMRADWLALKGFVASRFRDFDRAERWMAQALALAPDRAWIPVERASMLEVADKLEEALASARSALNYQPWFRPAVQAVAHLLNRQGHPVEAAETLQEASQHLESGILMAQLAAIQIDLQRYEQARESLDRYEELSPLLERDTAQWLAARRADVAYLLGNRTYAMAEARKVDEPFYTRFAEQLAEENAPADLPPERVMLSCTSPDGEPPLSVPELLGRYFDHAFPGPAPDAPTLTDGLPDAQQRRRAEEAGWVCREFTLSEETAHALLARGVPFQITLVEVGISQTRLVVGSDRLRGSLFLLDGIDRRPVEAPLSVIFERYRSTGPRCLVAVPGERVSEWDGLTFPDAEEYDHLYHLQSALDDREFTPARESLAQLKAQSPDHRLTHMAHLAWARATAHPVLVLQALEPLRNAFPADSTWVVAQASALRDLGLTDERRALLEDHGERHTADPLLMQSLAQLYLTDPHRHADAARLLRRSMRRRPGAAAGYYLLASLRWEQQEFTEAVELYRHATCLDDREEQFAETYARVARATGQGPEALRLFQQKATRTDQPHAPAVKALFAALLDRDEPDQAFSMLDRAIAKWQHVPEPRDGEPPPPRAEQQAVEAELRLFRAETLAQYGRGSEADEELAAVEPIAPARAWHRTAARIAWMKPDPVTTSIELATALSLDPLHPDLHRQLVALTSETQGRPAAREQVHVACQRFPYSYPLARMRAEFLAPDADDAALQAADDLLALCPEDAWAHRQRALLLADRERDAEATAAITRAGELEPHHPSYFTVLAHVHRRANRNEEALAACRRGLQHSIDNELLIAELVYLSKSQDEKLAALRFVVAELHRQTHSGDGLVAYRDQMLAVASSEEEEHADLFEELYTELDRVLDDRPDLWQAWSLMIQQLGLMGRLDEARSLAIDATERFPLLAQLWSDRSRVHAALEQPEEQEEALRSALAAAPGWTPITRDLAEVLVERGEYEEAIRLLRNAAARTPLDPTAHAALANVLWQADQADEALDRARHAVRLEPAFDAAWSMVAHWSERLDQPEELTALARELTRNRPGDVRSWLKLARILSDEEHNAEVLNALETVIRLDPQNVEAHDLRAERLAEAGRYDEALAATTPPELATDLPLVLRGRAAWIEAKRGNYAAAIPPMQALVSVEPNYYWGWQQLAEWYNDTGRSAGYLEAASELCRLKPDHPIPLTMRGEARLKTNDRAGGKTDLRDALRLAPQYAPAAAILFDACLADGEQREARSALAVLQEHAAGPEVLVKQLQFAARTGDADAAIRTFVEIAELPGEGPPIFLQLTYAELEIAGWGERAGKALREVWQTGVMFSPWAPLYWLDTSDGAAASLEDRLAAVEATVKAYPQFVSGHDRKAELLAQAGRFEEALAACRPPGLGEPLPLTLRGRAAWVEARRGNRTRAIAAMKPLVAEEPGYLWGWRQLSQWYDAEGKHKECHDAADRMVQLAPTDALAYGYRGEARRLLGDRPGAKADFQKAFELDPSFDAAGLHLIAEQLDADELDEAARTLNTLREHSSGPLVKLRAVEVAAKQGDRTATRQRFRSLLQDPEATRSIIREAAAAMDLAGWTGEADDDLDEMISSAQPLPASVAVWADRLIADDRATDVLDEIPALLNRSGAAGREAILIYAEAAAQDGRADTAGTTIHRFADHLREHTETWARAGAALAQGGSFALAASWLADWRDREELEPAMLRPLADSLRALDRDNESIEVCRSAVRLGGPPEGLASFRAWLALDAALDGRTAEAAGMRRAIDPLGLPDGVRLVLAMAEALVMVQQAGAEGKKVAFSEARDHLRTACGACDAADTPPGAARWYKRTVHRLAQDVGGITARLWATWVNFAPAVRE